MRLHVQNILPSNHFLHSCCAPQAEGAAGHLNLLYCDRLDARLSLLFYSHIFFRCSFGAFTGGAGENRYFVGSKMFILLIVNKKIFRFGRKNKKHELLIEKVSALRAPFS